MSEAERRLLTAAEETSQDEIVISPHRGQEEDGGVPTPLQHAMTVEVLTQDDHVDYANLLTPCKAPPNDSGHAGRGDELAEQQHRVEELEAILGALEGKIAEALALLELTEQEAQIAVTRASLRASESYRAQRGLELALACAEKRVAGSGGDDDNGVTPLQAVRRLASRLLPGRGLASWHARKAAATATATATAAAAAAAVATDEGADPATGGAGSSAADATPPNRLANQMYHTQLRRLREGGRHAAASAEQRAAAARGGGPSHSVSSSLVQATAAARRVEADRAAAKADDAWRSAARARTLVSQLSKAAEAAVAARDEAAAELSLARAALYDETSHGTSQSSRISRHRRRSLSRHSHGLADASAVNDHLATGPLSSVVGVAAADAIAGFFSAGLRDRRRRDHASQRDERRRLEAHLARKEAREEEEEALASALREEDCAP